MIRDYELLIGTVILILFLFIDGKNFPFSVPISVFTFVVLELVPDAGLLLRLSITCNLFLTVFLLENKRTGNDAPHAYRKIIMKNRAHFPFHENVRIAVTKHPYTYLYLKEGSVIRLRCSLTELLDTLQYLTRVSRNAATSENVEFRGDRFITEEKEISLQMLMNWGKRV
jgi:hypothetical protein